VAKMIELWLRTSNSVFPLKEYLLSYILEVLSVICLQPKLKVEVLMHLESAFEIHFTAGPIIIRPIY
jgi:hypothetical protein